MLTEVRVMTNNGSRLHVVDAKSGAHAIAEALRLENLAQRRSSCYSNIIGAAVEVYNDVSTGINLARTQERKKS